MSTRERAQMIINGLTDEQIEELVEFLEDNFLPEPPYAVHSLAEIEERIARANDDIKSGRVYTAEEVDEYFKERYGI
ncbi:MAG: hypothetical protein HDT42_00880 [Ruminococcaceae bacterium]|nr:hypothetical protein [Oscillospiraceae bacterium]